MDEDVFNSIKVRLTNEKETAERLVKTARLKRNDFDEAYNLGREAAYEMALIIIENEYNQAKSKNSVKYDFTQATRVKRTEKN